MRTAKEELENFSAALVAARAKSTAVLQALGIPSSILAKGSLAGYEIEDLFAKLGVGRSPLTLLEIGSFVGLTSLTLAQVLPTGSRIFSVDPAFPLKMQLAEVGSDDGRSCLEVARQAAEELRISSIVTFVRGFFSCSPTQELRDRLKQQQVCDDEAPIVFQDIQRSGPFDVVIVDGEHSTDAVFSDLVAAADMLGADGCMVVHDTKGKWGSFVLAGVERFLANSSDWNFVTADNLGFLKRRK